MPEYLTYNLIELDYATGGFWSGVYYWFNILEAAAWFLVGLYVLHRYIRNRRTPTELLYFVLFVAFGLTDVREAQSLPVWLLLLKIIIFAGIIAARAFLRRRYYREAKI